MKKALIQLHIAVFLAGFTAILGVLIKLNEGLLVWYRLLLSIIALLILQYYTKQLQKLPLKQSIYFDVNDGRMIFAIPRQGKNQTCQFFAQVR